jgi:hypothetical protein
MLVIPAKAGLSTAELVIQFFLGFDFQCRASTPPAEERVTSFFARAKKKVTKKETRGVTPQVLRSDVRKGCAGPSYVFVEEA